MSEYIPPRYDETFAEGVKQLDAPEWPDRLPVSTEALADGRRKAQRLHLLIMYHPDPVPDDAELPDTAYTCDGCAHAPSCALAFDLFNTDGDCLAGK